MSAQWRLDCGPKGLGSVERGVRYPLYYIEKEEHLRCCCRGNKESRGLMGDQNLGPEVGYITPERGSPPPPIDSLINRPPH